LGIPLRQPSGFRTSPFCSKVYAAERDVNLTANRCKRRRIARFSFLWHPCPARLTKDVSRSVTMADKSISQLYVAGQTGSQNPSREAVRRRSRDGGFFVGIVGQTVTFSVQRPGLRHTALAGFPQNPGQSARQKRLRFLKRDSRKYPTPFIKFLGAGQATRQATRRFVWRAPNRLMS
jgi:hypothetical protein